MTAQLGGGALDPQGPVSEAMADLWWLMLGLGLAVFVAVVVVLGLGLFRRRRGSEPPADRQRRDSFGRWFVVAGVVAPLVILVVVFGATVRAMRFVPTSAPPEALVIEVVGHQSRANPSTWSSSPYGETPRRLAGSSSTPSAP